MRIACLVFAKPPRPGVAKTRLAADLGDPGAGAALAGAFLRDTWAAVGAVDWRPILVTTHPDADHGIAATTWDQGHGDLGERLERTLRRALAEHDGALAIGADSPGIPPGHLAAARSALEAAPSALGPADDGGFWAIGVRACPEGLLAGVPWSTSGAFTAARARLPSPAILPAWWDVDRREDLDRLRREVPRARAPASFAALERWWSRS